MKAFHVLVISSLLAGACKPPQRGGVATDSMPSVAVRVSPATQETCQATEEIVGTVRSKQRAVIEAKVSGRIRQYLVVPGQRVRAGEVLAELDVQEIRARREQAAGVLDQARRDWSRQQQLIASKATSQQELDTAAARVNVAMAGLAEAETMLGYACVTAPFDAIVTRKLAELGDLAMPGKPLMELESPARLRFEIDLPESLLDRVKQGATLAVTIPSSPHPLAAQVVEISPVADPVSRTFLVKLDLPDDSDLRPGQFGRVAVPVASVQLLWVPRSSVLKRGQIEAVFVVRENHAILRLIKSGKLLGGRIEILAGVEPGDPVVTSDVARLSDGQTVIPQP